VAGRLAAADHAVIVAFLVERMAKRAGCSRTKGTIERDDCPALFQSACEPGISVNDYAMRLKARFGCSEACFVLALIYIDRLAKMHTGISVNRLSAHRLLLTSLVVATKFHDDEYYSNTCYAKSGGIKVDDLNAMEAGFLRLIGFATFTTPEEFSSYVQFCMLAARECPF